MNFRFSSVKSFTAVAVVLLMSAGTTSVYASVRGGAGTLGIHGSISTIDPNKLALPGVVIVKFKPGVTPSVQELFKVKVSKVNTLNVRGKFRRQRTKQAGQAPNWKKAIVTLKDGDKILLT